MSSSYVKKKNALLQTQSRKWDSLQHSSLWFPRALSLSSWWELPCKKGRADMRHALAMGPTPLEGAREMCSFTECLAPTLWLWPAGWAVCWGQRQSPPHSPSRVILGVKGIMEINCLTHCLAPTHIRFLIMIAAILTILLLALLVTESQFIKVFWHFNSWNEKWMNFNPPSWRDP